uniref:F5/8 type C domain-containing protein n=1 Tax=Hucho hucho TaxID=62062 RepID=A0A4W5PS13_9TELE
MAFSVCQTKDSEELWMVMLQKSVCGGVGRWGVGGCTCVCVISPMVTAQCEEALSSPLPHTAFTASSVFTSGYAPGYAKLNRRGGAGGWSPQDSDSYPWLQVDLGNRRQVVAVATQGRYSSSDWTTRYRLLYSDTGRNWKPYHQDGNIWVGNTKPMCVCVCACVCYPMGISQMT